MSFLTEVKAEIQSNGQIADEKNVKKWRKCWKIHKIATLLH